MIRSLLLSVVIITQPCSALDFSKIFSPPKKKTVEKARPKKKTPVKTTPKKKKDYRTYEVDPEWMAQYWLLESVWDYPIPEDKDIQFKNGKYIVPVVVYRHYEDMANTPKPSPTPKSLSVE